MQVQTLAYQNGSVVVAENRQYYLYNDALGRFNPVAPTGVLFRDEENALRFMSCLEFDNTCADSWQFFAGVPYYQHKGYSSCCVDADGETVVSSGFASQSLVVFDDRVVVNGKRGNPFSPFDSLNLEPDIVVYDQKHFRMSNMS
jgi:hypothetical protein